MRIKVSSDSTCDLGSELLSRFEIDTLPLGVLIDGQTRLDGVEITPADIFAYVDQTGKLCGTSAISVGSYSDYFAKQIGAYDAVIHVCIGSGFSSCYQNACIAAADFQNVYVVDSKNLSTGQGLVVLEAAELAQQGMAPSDIVAELARLVPRVEASFVLDRLDYMRKGGRCSMITVLGANVMKLKPCISVRDGQMVVSGKYRGSFETCIQKYVRDRLEGREDLSAKRVFLTDAAASPGAICAAEEAIRTYGNFNEILKTAAGCTITCHCGPSTLGVLFVRKD